MPTTLQEVLKNLIGNCVRVTTPGGEFRGQLASLNDKLIILCTDNGVAYINACEVDAVTPCV